MNGMNDQRFFDLAMKAAAGQSTAAERAELDALLAKQPELKAEFERLQADARLAKETLPLVAATESTTGEFPAYARGRLQTKVRQTYGRAQAKEVAEAKPNWLWLRWLAFATVAAVIALLVIPTFLQSGRPVIQLAMLDTAGGTRGGENNEFVALKNEWKEATVESFSKPGEAAAWENKWPTNVKHPAFKIIYDRAVGEVRILGRWKGGEVNKTFLVDKDLTTTLNHANDFIQEQLRKQKR